MAYFSASRINYWLVTSHERLFAALCVIMHGAHAGNEVHTFPEATNSNEPLKAAAAVFGSFLVSIISRFISLLGNNLAVSSDRSDLSTQTGIFSVRCEYAAVPIVTAHAPSVFCLHTDHFGRSKRFRHSLVTGRLHRLCVRDTVALVWRHICRFHFLQGFKPFSFFLYHSRTIFRPFTAEKIAYLGSTCRTYDELSWCSFARLRIGLVGMLDSWLRYFSSNPGDKERKCSKRALRCALRFVGVSFFVPDSPCDECRID